MMKGICWSCGLRTNKKLVLEEFYPKLQGMSRPRMSNKFGSSSVKSVWNHSGHWTEVEIWFCRKCRLKMEREKASDYANKRARELESEKREAEAEVIAKKKKAEAEVAAKEKAALVAAEKAAQHAIQEAKSERALEKQGMIKAGIPGGIVTLWVDGLLAKSQMFNILDLFGDKLPIWEFELLHICNPGHRYREVTHCPEYMSKLESIDVRVSHLHELILEFPTEMVKFTFTRSMNEEQLEFLKKCAEEKNLFNLYLAIVNNGFDIDFSARLVNDCGFASHPDALDEVIDGANWEAVAVKHGFLQF